MTKKRIFLSPPHMGGDELAYVKAAFESNYIAPLGSMVDRFEQDFAETFGLGHALALSSGTAAMHLALCVLGIGPGDEVFASTLTFIGSVTPVVGQVARPVFIDADRETWNMDPDLLAAELERCAKRGKLPKAVIPTDLYGQGCDYQRIFACCSRYQVPVVVDTAKIGEGIVICPFALVSDHSVLEDFVMVNFFASCAHDSTAGKYSILSPYATLNGGVTLGEEVFLGTHSAVAVGCKVGNKSKISAGSVAMRHVPPNTMVYGVPGKNMTIFSSPDVE
jgi:acetyltransferase-like isoleucine patch superfamily enzyme